MKMLGIRQKLSLGFGGLLAIILIIGFQSVTLLAELGGSIDLILRENYRSVIACQEMKEALERMDSGILLGLVGDEREGGEIISRNISVFEKALQVELNNITLPGEREKADRLQGLFEKYKKALPASIQKSPSEKVNREAYFANSFPLFREMKDTADEILQMNQANMSFAGDQAKGKAAGARRRMLMLLIVGAATAIGFMVLVSSWILHPIAALISSSREISSGNLQVVVRSHSKDEIGELSEAFDAMAANLREFRRTDQARYARIQRSTEQAFRFLPDAVAIVDAAGNIEMANNVASDAFDMAANRNIHSLPFQRVVDLFHEALSANRTAESRDDHALIQRFVRGEERFFRPRAIPITDTDKRPTGVIILLSDATQERHQNELKKGVISTVAHQLRTPLTSVRMALHLLLEEKVGFLNEKQAELAVAAREDSDRLYLILEQLLNMSRIESGKAQIDLRAVSAHELVFESAEPFRRAARDKGIALDVEIPDDLPEVEADPMLVTQAFANLLSNALKYTDAGGQVSISAEASEDWVVFMVSDTGRGIPAQYVRKILEQFFRVPGQGGASGVGLGLSIVQEIISAHGGTVDVKSEEGRGSVFTFSLPRADVSRKGDGK